MIPLGQRPILVEETYRALLDEIAEGRLAPGARLRQEALAEELQVSRQPISHALALLKQEGFLVEAGRRGLEVAPLDPDHLLALYQVRAALDGTAAGLAADRVARDDPGAGKELAALEASLTAGEKVPAEEIKALVRADMAFHRALNRLSGNAVILETAERQWGHLRRAMHAVLTGAYRAERVWQEHRAIVAAIRAGDAKLAAARAQAHAEEAGRITKDRLTQTGAGSAPHDLEDMP